MKRIIIFFLVFVTVIILCACEKGDKELQLWKDKDQAISDQRMDEIINIVNEKKTDDLIAIFSVEARNESKTLREDVEVFFEQFKGTELLWEDNDGPIVYESNDYGIKRKKIINWYEVFSIQGEKYTFFFVEWVVDEKNSDKEGVYTLRVINEEDLEKQFYEHSRMEIPGLYYKPQTNKQE